MKAVASAQADHSYTGIPTTVLQKVLANSAFEEEAWRGSPSIKVKEWRFAVERLPLSSSRGKPTMMASSVPSIAGRCCIERLSAAAVRLGHVLKRIADFSGEAWRNFTFGGGRHSLIAERCHTCAMLPGEDPPTAKPQLS